MFNPISWITAMDQNMQKGKFLHIYDCITEISDRTDKEVYFAKLFTSFPLLQVFKDQQIQTIDTVQTDHLGNDFKNDKQKIKHAKKSDTQSLFPG